MVQRERLNFTVDESQKERWNEFVNNNPEFDNLSEFLRTASEHEIKRGHPLEERQQQLPSEVRAQFIDIQDQLDSLESDLAWMRKQISDETDLQPVARRVNKVLPASHDEVMHRQRRSQENDEFVNTGTIQDLAKVIGEREKLVEEAITHLRNNFVEVRELTTGAGTTHYYLEENEY